MLRGVIFTVMFYVKKHLFWNMDCAFKGHNDTINSSIIFILMIVVSIDMWFKKETFLLLSLNKISQLVHKSVSPALVNRYVKIKQNNRLFCQCVIVAFLQSCTVCIEREISGTRQPTSLNKGLLRRFSPKRQRYEAAPMMC